jgi:hypothetical protein
LRTRGGSPFQGWKSNVDYNDFTQMNPF